MASKCRFLFVALVMTVAVLVVGDYYLFRLQAAKKHRIEGLRAQVVLHERENQTLEERNQTLGAEVQTLRSPDAFNAYEEKAREAYGMIGRNETFFVLPQAEITGIPDVAGLDKEKRREQAAPPSAGVADGGTALQLESLSRGAKQR